MTQKTRLLERLSRGPLTPLEAWRELGIYRLGARILDLRRAGHDIHTEMVEVVSEGVPARVARYWLGTEDQINPGASEAGLSSPYPVGPHGPAPGPS